MIEALKFVQKSRELKLLQRPEITHAIKELAKRLDDIPPSYASSLIHAVSKMKITDQIIWQSFALHVSQNAEKYDLRNLSTVVYALSKISQFKPVELNFDGLLGSLEV